MMVFQTIRFFQKARLRYLFSAVKKNFKGFFSLLKKHSAISGSQETPRNWRFDRIVCRRIENWAMLIVMSSSGRNKVGVVRTNSV